MRVLIACEFSGTVRGLAAAHGHEATSCDLIASRRASVTAAPVQHPKFGHYGHDEQFESPKGFGPVPHIFIFVSPQSPLTPVDWLER